MKVVYLKWSFNFTNEWEKIGTKILAVPLIHHEPVNGTLSIILLQIFFLKFLLVGKAKTKETEVVIHNHTCSIYTFFMHWKTANYRPERGK